MFKDANIFHRLLYFLKELSAILKSKNDPRAMGGILVDTGRFFLYPRVPPCRDNFLSIRPRIKILFTKLLEIENHGKKNLRVNFASGAHFPTFLTYSKRL